MSDPRFAVDVVPSHTLASWESRFVDYVNDRSTAAVMVVDPLMVPWVETNADTGESRHRHSVVAGKFVVDSPVAHLLSTSDVVVLGTDPAVSSVTDPANVGWQITYRGVYNGTAGWWFLVSPPDLEMAIGTGSWSHEDCRYGMNAIASLAVQRSLDARSWGWELWQFGSSLVYDTLASVSVDTVDGVVRAVQWTMTGGATFRSEMAGEIVESPNGGMAWDTYPTSWLGGPFVAFDDDPAFTLSSGTRRYTGLYAADDGSFVGVDDDGQEWQLEQGKVMTAVAVV